ncbi:hypothetical protein Pelo_18042 [Pelomyxa schiedti]|nr:hypothetical protein Pelo_18042 [Pelomyxa schiedti]
MGDEGDSYEAPKTSNKALTDALEKLNDTLATSLAPRVAKKKINLCNPDKAGTGELLKWLTRFQDRASSEDWNDEEAISIFRSSIEGAATRWLASVDSEGKSFKELLRQFMDEFVSASDKMAYKAALTKKTQKPGQPVKFFIKKMVQKWHAVEPHMDEIEMLEHITNSLKSNLKVWVSSMQPKSVKEMIKLAGQREAVLAWKEDHEMKKGKVLTTKKDESDDAEELATKRGRGNTYTAKQVAVLLAEALSHLNTNGGATMGQCTTTATTSTSTSTPPLIPPTPAPTTTAHGASTDSAAYCVLPQSTRTWPCSRGSEVWRTLAGLERLRTEPNLDYYQNETVKVMISAQRSWAHKYSNNNAAGGFDYMHTCPRIHLNIAAF